jgi:hypothetical protein
MAAAEVPDEEVEIRAVLETSAVLSYARGHVHVGELIVDIMEEGAYVGLPTVALLDAYSRLAKDEHEARARIGVLVATPGIVVLPLGPAEAAAVAEAVPRFAADGQPVANFDLVRAYATWAARSDAYYLTCEPEYAPPVLAGWQVHHVPPTDA